MELKQIQELIRFVAKSGVSEVQLEHEDFKIVIKAGGGEAPQAPVHVVPQVMQASPQMMPAQPPASPAQAAPQSQAAAPQAPAAAPAADDKYEIVRSPMIGTFYRRPSPDKEPFVQVGDTVTKGQVVCVIEAMKLFNEIEAEISGKIVKVLVDDSTPVEYDQPLFLVDPS